MDSVLMIVIFFAVLIGGSAIRSIVRTTKRKQKLEEDERKRNEKTAKINGMIKAGTWEFPLDKFYLRCKKENLIALDNEYSFLKAKQIAEQVILEADRHIDLANCVEYLSKDHLEDYFKAGELNYIDKQAKKEADKQRIAKKPTNSSPKAKQKVFMERASEIAAVSGNDKRVMMLKTMISDIDKKIMAKHEGEKALRQVGMIYAEQQQKESDWAIIGGIAEGIAGPAAGVMAATETMVNNNRIREHNAAMRKATMDIMSGLTDVMGDRIQLEESRGQLYKKLNEARQKIVLSKPTAEEIMKNIEISEMSVQRYRSGVVSVALTVALKNPFELDVPDGVNMVVDGTLKGEVWFEDVYVGDVFLPLPLYGIPSNMTEKITLDGMCGRSVKAEGEHTVRFGNTQNLWIMEA